jgi:hypothetical protein
MKTDKIVVIAFSFLGIIAGIISNYSGKFLSFVIPLIIYVASCSFMIKAIKSKVTDLIVNSLVTFVLVWIVVWILLFAG